MGKALPVGSFGVDALAGNGGGLPFHQVSADGPDFLFPVPYEQTVLRQCAPEYSSRVECGWISGVVAAADRGLDFGAVHGCFCLLPGGVVPKAAKCPLVAVSIDCSIRRIASFTASDRRGGRLLK